MTMREIGYMDTGKDKYWDRDRETLRQRTTQTESERQRKIYFLGAETDRDRDKLQALVYNILPSTTAIFSYAIGSRKLSANEQFFVGVQTVVSLLQTAQIKQGMSFIAANKVYTSTNKTTIVWIKTKLFLSPGVDASHVYVHALALGCFYSHNSTWSFQRALTASSDSCVEIKSVPSVA